MSEAPQRKPKAAENTTELVSTLRRWQEIEDGSVAACSGLMDQTENPLIRLVMEIIRQDSVMHKKVQQVMIDSLEKQAISLTPEELGQIWESIEQHAEMEKETIALAEKARKNCRLFILRHLLTYLIEDEQKHDRLLAQLEDFKRGIYPYA
jgi:type III secretory pathway component EscV